MNISFRYGMENVDIKKLTEMLSGAYWSKGIAENEVRHGLENSAECVSVYDGTEQIGFCRAVSDKTRFAYIMDVYIEEKYRRRGIGQRMLKFLMKAEGFERVYQWMLLTRDAHKFYEKVGFTEFSRPGDLLEIRKSRETEV